MKHCISFLFFSVLLLVTACQPDDDNGRKSHKYGSTNEWIESSMRSMYFWHEDIPNKSELNEQLSPEIFFNSLLSEKDGKNIDGSQLYYSYIEKKKPSGKSYYGDLPSMGFEFQLWLFESTGKYAVNILYILPNSPASRKGMKRGDWILTIDDQAVNPSNVSKLIQEQTLKLGISKDYADPTPSTVTLSSELVFDNPIYLDTIYDTNKLNVPDYAKNKKIGYLVYNHFTSGPNGDSDETFNNDLRKVFAKFKTGGVNDCILDLRYNMGGIVTSAQLLATMVAPASALNQEFCHLVYNDKQSVKNRTLLLSTQYMREGANGENLDLQKLFIITSVRTASASEAVINGLKPYLGDNIILIGMQTEGKNVGSITIEHPDFEYELHPIVCQLFNKNNESDYVNGFSPNFNIKEDDDRLLPLGDTNEPLLNKALQSLFGSASGKSIQTPQMSRSIPVFSSLDRRATNGVLIPEQ